MRTTGPADRTRTLNRANVVTITVNNVPRWDYLKESLRRAGDLLRTAIGVCYDWYEVVTYINLLNRVRQWAAT